MSRSLFFIPVLLLAAGCGSSDKPAGGPNPVSESVSYATVWKTVLEPQCRSCHGLAGAMNVDKYDEVKGHLDAIRARVLGMTDPKQKMPPKAQLTSAQADTLRKWLDAGAPLTETPRIPTETPIALAPTFESIRQNILVPKCQVCHSKAGRMAKLPLEKVTDLTQAPTPDDVAFVKAGDPANSPIMEAITRTDRQRMPPDRSKIAPLSDPEVAAVRQWIQAGAKP